MQLKHILTPFLLLLYFGSYAQSSCIDTVYLTTNSYTVGNQMAIDIEVSNFNNIQSVQFGFQYDPSVVTFASSGNYNLNGLGANSLNTNQLGFIRFIWFDQTATMPQSLSDNSSLITLYFDNVTTGDPSFQITDLSNFIVEIGNDQGENLCVNYSGTTTGGGNSGGNNGGNTDGNEEYGCVETIQVSTNATDLGNLVAVDFEVQNFHDISTLQFGISYNSNALSFSSVNNFNINGLNENHFNPSIPGEIKMLWYDESGVAPQTIVDGNSIFTLYFTKLTTESYNMSITYLDDFVAQATDNNDNLICLNDIDPNYQSNSNNNVTCVDTLYMSMELYNEGDMLAVDIIVDDFNDIQSLQFAIDYNENAISYVGAGNYGLFGLNAASSVNSPGLYRFIWFDPSGATPQTLANGSSIITIYFDPISSFSPDLFFASNFQFYREASNSNGELVCINTTNPNITNPSSDCLEVSLTSSFSLSSKLLNVSVDNFTDIKAANFGISYDSNITSLIGINNLNSNLQLTADNFTTNDGLVNFSWDNETALSLTNGETLYQLEFSKPINGTTNIVTNTNAASINVINSEDEVVCFQGDSYQISSGNGPIENTGCVDTVYIDLIPHNGSSELSVDLQAYNFSNIASMQFTIAYDASHLSYTGYESASLDIPNSSLNDITPGIINFLWLEPNVQNGISVTDGEVLFTINFEANTSDQSLIGITDDPVPIEITKFHDGDLVLTCLNVQETLILSEGALLSGYLKHDIDDNCTEDTTDIPLKNWIIQFNGLGNQFYSSTDENGYYEALVIPGEYNISAITPNALWGICQNDQISITANNGDLDEVDFLANTETDCPFLYVDISTPFLRRCFSNTYKINYCNYGTIAESNAYIEVTLDDDLIFENTSYPDYSIDDNVLTFEIGALGVNECGTLSFEVTVSCDAMLGATHCTEANIYPVLDCTGLNSEWTGASLRIIGNCDGDSVRFNIINDGIGDMLQPSEFIVIEDDVMLNNDEIILLAGEQLPISYEANGSTYRVSVEQVDDHPGQSEPTLFIEGCDSDNDENYSTGFANMFPQDDNDPWKDIDCQENIGSYDPNDKQAFPKGYGDEHYIKQNTSLEFKIRFQNTGTDTAFKVVVIDTLSTNLDVSTFRVGASSHDYELIIRNQEVKFIFNNIQLVDSFANEPASHGFITYHIDQKADLEDGHDIFNQASIYFDFNDPILTNRTYHEIGSDFIAAVLNVTESNTILTSSQVFPHPLVNQSYVKLGEEIDQQVELKILDIHGRTVRIQSQYGSLIPIYKDNLVNGVYFYEVSSNGVLLSNGKLVIQ